MKALLHLQLKNNGISILFVLILTFVISLLYAQDEDRMSIAIYALIFSLNSYRSFSLLKEQKIRYFIHSLPIARREIVTAIYVSTLFYISIIYLVLLPTQIYRGFYQNELEDFLIPFAGLFAVSIASAALEIYLNFRSNDFKESMTDSLLSLFGALFFILLPHMGLLLWNHEPSFYLRLLVFPIISIVLFYFSLKKSIRLYETKEVI